MLLTISILWFWILLEEMNELKEAYWRNVSRLQQLVSGTKVRKQKIFPPFWFYKTFSQPGRPLGFTYADHKKIIKYI